VAAAFKLRLGGMAVSTGVRTSVDFWFDPSCPWAWMASRWVDEVAALRPLDVTWHIMSLAVLNEHKTDLSEHYREFLPRALRYTRLAAAVCELHGAGMLKPLYDALGTRIHPGGRTDVDAVVAESLAELGLPAELAVYADRDDFEPQMRASHEGGTARVGAEVGTPVIAVGGSAFFGPVISPAPKGEQAAALWDGLVAVAAYDGFFEIKRSRTREPEFD
jgi:2-hydroxychromene-2-carboxylate isomerase